MTIYDIKEFVIKKTDSFSEWLFMFRRKKEFKFICIAFAVLLTAGYAFGLYMNQKRIAVFAPDELVYHVGERIAFGKNYMDMYTTANGYYITFTDAYATDFDAFMDSHEEFDRSEIIKWLSYDPNATVCPVPHLIILNALLENVDCTENWDTCLDTRNFTLYCEDWYNYNLIDISHLLNPSLEDSYCIFTPPGEQAEITLVFGFSEKEWEYMGKKDIRLNLTYGPQKIDFVFDLAYLAL